MKKLLNTLYVTTQGTYLAKEGECVVVRVGDEVRMRVPVHSLGGVVCFGQVSCSPFLMGFAAERGLGFSFLTEHGRFLARVQGPISGNVLLRREQYRRADSPEASAEVARAIISAKVVNARRVLQRAMRDHGDKVDGPALETEVFHLRDCLMRLQQPVCLDVVRGIEGEAAKGYFSVFDNLILTQEPGFRFEGAAAVPRGIESTACCRSSTRCSHTMYGAPWKASGWTRRWDSCTATGPEGTASRLISWKSSELLSPTGWRCRSSILERSKRTTSRFWKQVPSE